MYDSLGQCDICDKEHTSTHAEVMPGTVIYVCKSCLEKAKENFIWLCISCGKVYMKPKELVISRVKDRELKRAYLMCRDAQIIQGIDMCISCSPERVIDYVEAHQVVMEC